MSRAELHAILLSKHCDHGELGCGAATTPAGLYQAASVLPVFPMPTPCALHPNSPHSIPCARYQESADAPLELLSYH